MATSKAKVLSQDDIDAQAERLQAKREKIAQLKMEETVDQQTVELETAKKLLDNEEERLDAELAAVEARSGLKTMRAKAVNLDDAAAEMALAVEAQGTETKEK